MVDNFIIEQSPFEQVKFGTDSFADNPEPRCPCLLLLDTSYSMSGRPIEELNDAIASYKEELLSDSLASKRVEVAVVTFGPVEVVCGFHTAQNFYPQKFIASSDTPMGQAIEQGIRLVHDRKTEYKENGISFYRPWIFMITDGAPTDNWNLAADMIREGEEHKSFAFFAVGIQQADMNVLKAISVREPLKLQGLKFQELFLWLSNSMKTVSRSSPEDKLMLPPPSGWAEL